MPFLPSTEKRGRTVRVDEIMIQYADIFQVPMPAASFDSVAFRKLSDWSHVYCHLHYWVKGTI